MNGFQLLATALPMLRKTGWMLGIAVAVFLAACTRGENPVSAAPGTSQSAAPGTASDPAAQKDALPLPPLPGLKAPSGKRPTWAELTPAQQQALAPLAGEWNRLDPVRKKKWLEIAAKYAQMSPAQQQRLQIRMREWAQLTPEQRRIARESYARAKKLGIDQKSAKWEHYQSLPAEEKQKLAARAEKKKNVANLPRPQSSRSRNTLQTAKSVPPVLPSAPPHAGSAPAPVAPPVTTTTVPAPAVPAVPAGIPNESIGDPLSTPSR